MPEIRVTDEQGTVHVFPDGSTPEMISKAMNLKPPDRIATAKANIDSPQGGKGFDASRKDPNADGAIMANAKGFFGDMWDSVKHLPELFQAPQNDEEKKAMLTPGGLPVYRMAKGYYNATRQNVGRAEASAEKGDNVGVVINSAAAGLPLVGPLVGGLYEDAQADKPGMVGKGASRIVQAASMAPEGSVIPNPVNAVVAGANKVRQVAAPAKQAIAESLYQSALKPSPTLGIEGQKALVKTGLENNIPVSEGGLVKLNTLIDDYNTAIRDEIASKPGAKIDPNKAAARADDVKAGFRSQVNAAQDMNAVEASKQQFLREQGAQPAKPGTPPQPTGVLDANGNPVMSAGTPGTPAKPAPMMDAVKAQDMKIGTYRSLGKKAYGEVKGATIEAQKGLARGIKEELVNEFPELEKLNSAESKALDLEPILAKAIGRIGNHQIVGIGTPAVAAGTEAVTGSAKAAGTLATMKAVLDNPWVKSRIAIRLNKAGVPYKTATARVAAYVNALSQAADAGNSGVQSSGQPQE
jgi:hypothetical protein